MSTKFTVTVNPTTLITTLTFVDVSAKVINSLLLTLNISNADSQVLDDKIILPWHDFKRNLIHISRILKTNNIDLDLDNLSKKFVDDFIQDRKNIKAASSAQSNADFVSILKQIGFDRTLTKEQVRDVGILLSLRHGANFSVPGAGKTTTLLAVHALLEHQKITDKLFVVCPVNAFISWEDEIRTIFPSQLKVMRLTTNLLTSFGDVIDFNPDVILINYEKLRKESTSLVSFFLGHKVHLILDESHRIKGGYSNLSFPQISKLSDLSRRRDILSGTPMPQSYLDLQPQFELLWPAETIIPDLSNVKDEFRSSLLNNAIKNLYVRTTKNELGLKEPNIFYTKIRMGSLQNELYKLCKSETARILSGMDRSSILNFRQLGKSVVRLIQASTNPMLLTLNDDFYEETLPIPESSGVWELLDEFVKYEKPSKIEYLQTRVDKILSESSKNKIVIWSYFVRNIQLLERVFKTYNPVSIYGNISTGSDEDENKREGRIKRFHTDETCRLMIANPQACGEGISLHKVCHYAIYLDRNFNAAHFLQSIDRIHRLGLPPDINTNVEILVSENTIDEILLRRLNEKILAMGEILDDKYLKTLAYDPADIPIYEENGIDGKDVDEIKKHIYS